MLAYVLGVDAHDLIELADEPRERRGKAEEVGVDALDEGHGRLVELRDDLVAVLECVRFELFAIRLTKSVASESQV